MIDPSIIAIDLDYLVKDHPDQVRRIAAYIARLDAEVKRANAAADWQHSDAQAAHRICEEHEAEIKRLRGVVDRLEKTNDGVPLCPGDTVFVVANDCYLHGDDEAQRAIIECVYLDGEMAQCGYDWRYTAKPGAADTWEEFDVESLWSTREAAEAAKGTHDR